MPHTTPHSKGAIARSGVPSDGSQKSSREQGVALASTLHWSATDRLAREEKLTNSVRRILNRLAQHISQWRQVMRYF